METIKCKSCGAVQEVSNEASLCNFCGNAIEMQQSKDFYKEIVKSEFGNYLMMAETAEEATNYEEAIKYYNKILEKDTTYSDAWLGKGNCLIYSSKIGDIKMKEALTYWKNAIKFAEHQAPMKLRVGKEINNVVNTFFPNLLNHYNEFSGLDNSYVDLAGRFLTLEGAIDYAVQICPDEPEFFQTGFDLCELVIKAPGASATSAQYAAVGSAIFNSLSGDKYAAKTSGDDWNKANERKKQIQNFGNQIQLVANKYLDGLVRLGVKSESDKAASVNVKPIDVKEFKTYKNEYIISIIVFFALILGSASIGESGSPVAGILFMLVVFSYVFYIFNFLSKFKKKFEMSFSAADKMMRNK